MVANYTWDLDSDILITRGGMETPEQHLPDASNNEPWEACYTMGYHWQYVAEENYISSNTLINLLIETRAKGGNLLLNVGPDTHGEIPAQQESRLREIGLWHMANHEAIENVRSWKITNENDIWFTKSKDDNFVYAFVNVPYWKHMEEKAFFIHSINGSSNTKVSILGQNDEMMEYLVQRSPKSVFSVVEEGIFINVVKA